MSNFEAAVIGAGPTGLVAALALARMGVQVGLVGPSGVRPCGADPSAPPADQRTTALMAPSVKLLKNLGVLVPDPQGRRQPGEASEPTAHCLLPTAMGSDPQGLTPDDPEGLTPITAVRIADDRGGLIRAPEMVFRAAELGLASFGANVANETLLAGLRRAAERVPGLAWVETAGVRSVAPEASWARLELAEGGSVAAALAVAADGRNSAVRESAGIRADTWVYPQAAIATRFAHTRPHDGVVNELHRHAGPLTTVPLPGRRCALVWVEEAAEARRLAGLDAEAFAAVLEERLQGVLGGVGDVALRAVFPLSGLAAERLTGRRVALVGEAAHVVPPIGAQGLNLGLRDVAALADCVAEARAGGQDIGGPATLAAYQRARAWDVRARSVTIDLLNRSLLADMLPVDMLRGLAAHLVASSPLLRRLLMQEGMGLAGPLPSLMR